MHTTELTFPTTIATSLEKIEKDLVGNVQFPSLFKTAINNLNKAKTRQRAYEKNKERLSMLEKLMPRRLAVITGGENIKCVSIVIPREELAYSFIATGLGITLEIDDLSAETTNTSARKIIALTDNTTEFCASALKTVVSKILRNHRIKKKQHNCCQISASI
jgi:hypothetical protein